MEVPQWVKDRYGDVEIHPLDAAMFKVVEFVEVEGDNNLGVYVSDEEGNPIRNVAVVMWYPTAEMDGFFIGDEAGWLRAGHVGYTNEAGYVGFPMGGGSYYFPQDGQYGPQHVWLFGEGLSEMVSGLGMLGQTHYCHVDVHFELTDGSSTPIPPPPEPEPEPGWYAKIVQLLKEILVELRRLSGNEPPPP